LFTDIEIAAFDFALRIFDGTGYPRMLDGLAVAHAQLLHQTGNTIGSENTHQGIFKRQIKTR
jgi:hypothetical protein